jgi:hypothetical protein
MGWRHLGWDAECLHRTPEMARRGCQSEQPRVQMRLQTKSHAEARARSASVAFHVDDLFAQTIVCDLDGLKAPSSDREQYNFVGIVSQFHPLYKDKYVCIVIFSSNLTRVCFCILLISFCSAPPIAFFDSLRLERVDCHVFFDLDRHMSLAEKEQYVLSCYSQRASMLWRTIFP